MSLTKQLLAFGLLTLVLPWAGFRYVQEMERALRSGLEASLLASAGTAAQVLEGRDLFAGTAPFDRGSRTGALPVYAHALAAPPRIDGSRSDWSVADDAGFALGDTQRAWAGINGRFVYVYVEADDDAIVYQRSPGQSPYGDRLVMLLEPRGSPPRWLVFATAAPGVLRAQETAPPRFAPNSVYDDRVLGAWQETATGFQIELRLPLSLIGTGLGLALIDVDPDADGYAVGIAASWDTASSVPGEFVYQRPGLREALAALGRAGDRLRVIDSRGWVIADTGAVGLDARLLDAPAGGLTEDIVRTVLRRNDPSYESLESPPGRIADPALLEALSGEAVTAWYRTAVERDAIVTAAVPITEGDGVIGAVLVEQASDSILTVTNQALLRLMSLTLSAALIAMLGLLGFATYLSLRVRRLARAAEGALGPKGQIRTRLPGSRSSDEIGDLARSFGSLLERLRDYTEYLRTLTSKLSHELRTPLAVVSTSLDNLEQEYKEPGAAQYLGRLRQGATRLDAILAAMSEATRMEQAIADTVPEVFSLVAVVESCSSAYADVYPERVFAFETTGGEARVVGSRELAAQLMDKLVDNAVGFSPPGSRIEIAVVDAGGDLRLSVANPGPSLPGKMREQIFDSLVSVREGREKEPHLGLGLYVAALIVEFHHGRIEANNLPDGSGVRFDVWLPRAD